VHTPQCIPLHASIVAHLAPEPGSQLLVPSTLTRNFGALSPGQAFCLTGPGRVVFETESGSSTMVSEGFGSAYFVALYPVKNVRVDAFLGNDCWGHFVTNFAAWMSGGDGRYSRGP